MTELIPDAEIGRKVGDTRTFMGITQNELAERLTAQGLPFYQTTVSRVEEGARPLRLNEAVVVASVLNVPVATFIGRADLTTAEYWDAGRRQGLSTLLDLIQKEINR